MLNPPYGVRLGAPHQTAALYDEIAAKLRQSYKGWDLALVVPHIKLAAKLPCRPTPSPLLHGGLKLVLLTGRIG